MIQKAFVIPRMPISIALILARNGREATAGSHCRPAFRLVLVPGRQRLPSPHSQCYHTTAAKTNATACDSAASYFHRNSLLFQKKWMTSSTSPSTIIKTREDEESNAIASASTSHDEKVPAPPPIIYESPLGSTVHRLRTLSLMTALAGIIGVPVVMVFKGMVPEVGTLAAAMSYVCATTASTAAINFVFRPYIYSITVIPVRQCSYQKKTTTNAVHNATNPDAQESDESKEDTAPQHTKDTLLKAVTRNVFLRQVEVVFNPETDVHPHKGFRPLCNFEVKGVPLYVHSEHLYDKKLRKALKLGEIKDTVHGNPDDDFL